jgi:formylglycine-generating enzyme
VVGLLGVLGGIAIGCAGPAQEGDLAVRGFSFQRQRLGSFLGTSVRDRAKSPFNLEGDCPNDMVLVGDRFCIDRYEATLVEETANGSEQPHPYFLPVGANRVRAVSRQGVYPQGYISGKEAQAACAASGKRLCKAPEWVFACRGPQRTTYPYGNKHERRRCNDHGISVRRITTQTTFDQLNDPIINQTARTLSKTGEHEGCTNEWGVHDMVGNLHEWVDASSGTFLGGYYQDTNQNGEGCGYATRAHAFSYHDYSTGFRCCKDLEF